MCACGVAHHRHQQRNWPPLRNRNTHCCTSHCATPCDSSIYCFLVLPTPFFVLDPLAIPDWLGTLNNGVAHVGEWSASSFAQDCCHHIKIRHATLPHKLLRVACVASILL